MLPIIVDEGDRQIVIFGCVNHHGIKLSVGGIAGRNPHIPGDRNSLRADQQAPFRIFIRVAAMNQNKCKIRNISDVQHTPMKFLKSRAVSFMEPAFGPQGDLIIAVRNSSFADDFFFAKFVFQTETDKFIVYRHSADGRISV